VKKLLMLLGVCLAAAALAVAAFGHDSSVRTRAAKVTVRHDLWFELVGQFQNSGPGVTPVTHIHYGYLPFVQGVSAFLAPQSLSTALFTFFADGKTSPPTTNGPLVFANRVGTLTVYRDPSRNSDWAKPDTFRNGTPVLVAQYRHQPISSSLTGAVTLFSEDTITVARPFDTGHGKVQLGKVGEKFVERYTGQSNMPGPPSGYFIGWAVSR
jgi:hypothetical protein